MPRREPLWWYFKNPFYRNLSACKTNNGTFIWWNNCVCESLSHVWLFAIPWTVTAHQPPLSMEFSRQEYWSELPFPSLGDLPGPGIKPRSPALQADSLPSKQPGSLRKYYSAINRNRLGTHKQHSWTLKAFAKWKKSNPQNYIQQNSIYMTFW